jgi:hypothetical protein
MTEGFKTSALYDDVIDFTDENANGITEGFKTAALYGDVPFLPSE